MEPVKYGYFDYTAEKAMTTLASLGGSLISSKEMLWQLIQAGRYGISDAVNKIWMKVFYGKNVPTSGRFSEKLQKSGKLFLCTVANVANIIIQLLKFIYSVIAVLECMRPKRQYTIISGTVGLVPLTFSAKMLLFYLPKEMINEGRKAGFILDTYLKFTFKGTMENVTTDAPSLLTTAMHRDETDETNLEKELSYNSIPSTNSPVQTIVLNRSISESSCDSDDENEPIYVL